MIPLAAISFARSWWKALVGFLVAAPLFFLLGQCDGKKIERKAWEARVAELALKAEQQQRRADQFREAAEMVDRERIQRNRTEVDNAVNSLPDQSPSARQRARACVELRRQASAAGQPQPAC